MAAQPRKRRMNREEALGEISADRDSDDSDFSDIRDLQIHYDYEYEYEF